MLRSLVGSEMCIRDRGTSNHAAERRGGLCILCRTCRYLRQQKPPVNHLGGGTETNVGYHVAEPPTVASSADMQPDADLSYYVNAADVDPTLADFDSLRTAASKADSRSSGYQSVDGSVWDVMSFDNPLFRAFPFRGGSGRRQLISPPSPGPLTQSTV